MTAKNKTTEAILKERGKTHGDFADNAKVSQELKFIIRTNLGVSELTYVQREALDMICLKVSRILSNPNVKDHWDDIAGYATLASKDLEK